MNQEIAEKIAGEITLSTQPGQTIKKWREAFKISQLDLAEEMGISPSIICDYESGRRKSPGVTNVRKIVNTLIRLGSVNGNDVLKHYTMMKPHEAICAIRDMPVGVPVSKFVNAINGKVIAVFDKMEKMLYGYTVIDSVKAILSLTSHDYLQVYGWSSERALIFTGVKYGRSPMVAIRAHPMKPAVTVFHRPERIDELAIRLAELENIPLITTDMPLDELTEKLRMI